MRLILSVGGARGSFQAGAYQHLLNLGRLPLPEAVYGNSVGALNGLLIACGSPGALVDIWASIRNREVYRHRTNLFRYAWAALTCSPALDTGPLKDMIRVQSQNRLLQSALTVGRVDLKTGEYETAYFQAGSPALAASQAVYDSSATPFLMPLTDRQADGGGRYPLPLRDAMSTSTVNETMVIISCHPIDGLDDDSAKCPTGDAARMFEIMQNALVRGSLRPFLMLNRMLSQLAPDGWTDPETGQRYLPYKTILIAPEKPLPWGMLDFDNAKQGLELGRIAADKALSR